MANLTIVVPDEVLKQARQRAVGQGTSVNAVLRNYLGQYAGVDATLERAGERLLKLTRSVKSNQPEPAPGNGFRLIPAEWCDAT